MDLDKINAIHKTNRDMKRKENISNNLDNCKCDIPYLIPGYDYCHRCNPNAPNKVEMPVSEVKPEDKPKRKREYIPKVKICSCCGSFAHGKFHYNF